MTLTMLERMPTSAISERELMHGYQPARVSRPCGCGGWIEAIDTRDAITEAVAVHNSSTAHGAWAIAHGWRHG